MRNTSKIIDLAGQKFNYLTVIRIESRNPLKWLCKCDCGNLHVVSPQNLKRGLVKSCGCARKGHTPTHNMSNTRMYRIYRGIIRRCYNKHEPAYPRYGGRGILMCDEWKADFLAFYNWSISHGYNETLTIDRIDSNKGYSPDNCRWVDMKAQSNNRRNCIMFTYNNKTQTVKQWCEELGLKYGTVHSRICRGWPVDEALLYMTDARINKRRKDDECG